MKFSIGLQPWTIRRELDQDFFGAFAKVANIGYQAAEIGMPPQGIEPAEMKARFDRIGLKALSCHTDIEHLTHKLDALLEYVRIMDCRYLVLSYYRFTSGSEVREVAKLLNKIGEKCQNNGVQLLYHNHDWEFVEFDGEYALDILLRETDPSLVQMELDVYWVSKAGQDPIKYIQMLKGRCPLLHVKDMEPGEERYFAEVGEGILPMEEIIHAAGESGTKWLIVEQDECRRSPFDCIATSYNNLKSMEVI